MANSDVSLTLKEAVAEVLQSLTGMDLEYAPSSTASRRSPAR